MRHRNGLFMITFRRTITCAILLCYSLIFLTPRSQTAPKAKEKQVSATVISGYRHWTRANKVPQKVISYVALLCRNPVPEEIEREKANPHNDKFITVYVNEKGRQALLKQVHPHFPAGSILVKEKLPAADSTHPELLTIMRKRNKGFSPKYGDWEYLVADGQGKHVGKPDSVEKCRSCHADWKATDFVSRRYLPYEVTQRMR